MTQKRKVRRAPNIAAFLATGGAIGLVVGFLIDRLGVQDMRYDAAASFGFIGLGCAALGVLLAGIVAVLLDKRS